MSRAAVLGTVISHLLVIDILPAEHIRG